MLFSRRRPPVWVWVLGGGGLSEEVLHVCVSACPRVPVRLLVVLNRTSAPKPGKESPMSLFQAVGCDNSIPPLGA